MVKRLVLAFVWFFSWVPVIAGLVLYLPGLGIFIVGLALQTWVARKKRAWLIEDGPPSPGDLVARFGGRTVNANGRGFRFSRMVCDMVHPEPGGPSGSRPGSGEAR